MQSKITNKDALYATACITRQKNFARFLQEQHIAAAIFEDTEDRRDPSVRYFTGHPSDALFIITAKGDTVLCPWDEHLAQVSAVVHKIVPLTKFSRNPIAAAQVLLQKMDVTDGSRIDISPSMPYPQFLRYVDALAPYHVLCRENGSHEEAVRMRTGKDAYELQCIREAAAITDTLINELETECRNGTIHTETDAALLIERRCRELGCEGTGFTTLAAGSQRSYAIHCFPPYTAGKFPAEGLSLIDFGVVKNGYTSDVTLTFAKGTLSHEQEHQLDLVQQAYDAALELYNPGIPVQSAAAKADAVFSKAKRVMPHSLGHGIGLEAHESPVIKPSVSRDIVFTPGMVVTLEPGLYHPVAGGCRLENDILITEAGHEVLTHSRIIRL